MTRISQKNFEKKIAEFLSQKLNLNWKISIPKNETEWPDILIEDKFGKFGLEVREYYTDEGKKGSQQKRVESDNHSIIKEIKTKYFQKNSFVINVDFVGKLNVNLASKILNKLDSLSLDIWDKIETSIQNKETRLSMYVLRIPDKFHANAQWRCVNDHIGFIDSSPVSKINHVIQEKAKNLSKYKKHLNRVSLLLFINSAYASGMLKLNENDSIQTCGFENVYIIHNPYNVFKFSLPQ